ncbi:MAG: AraC family transcriptional regulator [Thalassobius sp.]|nr:AraC family transcriptional regulator [Thalassovita sp.]
MKYEGINGEYFEVIDITNKNCYILKAARPSELSLLWFQSDNNQIKIDALAHSFNTHDIVCLTEFNKIEVVEVKKLRLLRFNRAFFCIADHDSKVGCKGILYYGAANLPILYPTEKDIDILGTVWKMLCIEMESKDSLQFEMLQMMLKRILILCTRVYRNQINFQVLENGNVDIIRDFNFLVEKHFRDKHNVAEYADLLNKAPKTLSNLFKKIGEKTPLQFIQDRLMLESRRLLRYTDKDISQIGYELGFNDVQSFSRFFKKQEGASPLEFRNLK